MVKLCLFILVAFALGLAELVRRRFGVFDGIDWPAWVQAVGSVLAIVAAIIIDQGSVRRADRLRQADLNERRKFRERAIDKAADNLVWLKEQLDCTDTARLGTLMADNDLDLLRGAISVLDFYTANGEVDHELVSSLLFVRARCSTALRACERFVEKPTSPNWAAAGAAVEGALNDVSGSIRDRQRAH